MTLTTAAPGILRVVVFQMPVRSMTLTTIIFYDTVEIVFQMPVRSMTLTTAFTSDLQQFRVSDACQINDFDHSHDRCYCNQCVSDACQINDFDHYSRRRSFP